MNNPNGALHELGSLFDVELLSATATAIHTKASGLSREAADRLVHVANDILENSRNEQERVAAAKVLIGLVPESIDLIQEWFEVSKQGAHEAQFSLLCFLDEIPAMGQDRSLSAIILAMVSRFLMNISSEAANAAWMAGDLLGDHWDLADSLPVLLNAARNARFVAGRLGALHGIEHAIESPSDDPKFQTSIYSAVREVARSDPSSRVREFATLLLDGKKNVAPSE